MWTPDHQYVLFKHQPLGRLSTRFRSLAVRIQLQEHYLGWTVMLGEEAWCAVHIPTLASHVYMDLAFCAQEHHHPQICGSLAPVKWNVNAKGYKDNCVIPTLCKQLDEGSHVQVSMYFWLHSVHKVLTNNVALINIWLTVSNDSLHLVPESEL